MMKSLKFKILLVSIFAMTCWGSNLYSQENYIVAGYHDSTTTYFDINSDTLIQVGDDSSEALNIDLDNDGVVDFIIAASSYSALGSSSSSITFSPKNENGCVLGRVDTVYGYQGPRVREVAGIQDLGDTLNGVLNFTGSFKYVTLNSYQEGYHFYITDWIDIGEKYLAFEFISNDTTYYGWIRIEVTGIRSVYVKDYAFNKRSYSGVNNTYVENLVSVFPNPANDFINIKTNNNELSKVTIVDISGKVLKAVSFNNSIKLEIKEFNQGIYFLEVETNNKVVTKRIVIN